MSINTVEYVNQLMAENADLKKQVQGLNSRLQLVSELSDAAAALHVEAEKQVQALAAENSILDFIISAVKEIVRDSEGVTGWHLNGDVATWDEVLPELDHGETPATDAAIREIGAKAIEGFADDWQGEDSHSAISEMARGYANKLRAGEEQP